MWKGAWEFFKRITWYEKLFLILLFPLVIIIAFVAFKISRTSFWGGDLHGNTSTENPASTYFENATKALEDRDAALEEEAKKVQTNINKLDKENEDVHARIDAATTFEELDKIHPGRS